MMLQPRNPCSDPPGVGRPGPHPHPRVGGGSTGFGAGARACISELLAVRRRKPPKRPAPGSPVFPNTNSPGTRGQGGLPSRPSPPAGIRDPGSPTSSPAARCCAAPRGPPQSRHPLRIRRGPGRRDPHSDLEDSPQPCSLCSWRSSSPRRHRPGPAAGSPSRGGPGTRTPRPHTGGSPGHVARVVPFGNANQEFSVLQGDRAARG